MSPVPEHGATSAVGRLLPPAFAALEPFCPRWLHATEARRNAARIGSTMQEIRAFYDAAMGCFEPAIAHLNTHALDALPPPERNLLDLLLAFVEASTPVERFDSPIVTKDFPPQRFFIHEQAVATGW